MAIEQYTGEAYQNSALGFHALAADQDKAKTPLQQADLTSISYWIRNTVTDTFSKSDVSLTVADVITDTTDTYGDNFHVTFPSNSFPNTGIHEITFKFTAADGTVTYDVVKVTVCEIDIGS